MSLNTKGQPFKAMDKVQERWKREHKQGGEGNECRGRQNDNSKSEELLPKIKSKELI